MGLNNKVAKTRSKNSKSFQDFPFKNPEGVLSSSPVLARQWPAPGYRQPNHPNPEKVVSIPHGTFIEFNSVPAQ